MWKISVQMARFPALCFSRRQAAIAEFPRAGVGGVVLCVTVVKLEGFEEPVVPCFSSRPS